MRASSRRYRTGIVVSALALIALVAALAAGAQAAGGFTTCPNKAFKLRIETGEGSTTPYTVTIKTISVKGTSCAAAYEFLRLTYKNEKISSTGSPQHYKCTAGEFKVPTGYIPRVCAKPGKTIRYAGQGG